MAVRSKRVLKPAEVTGAMAAVSPRWRPRVHLGTGVVWAVMVAGLVLGAWPGTLSPSIALIVPGLIVVAVHLRAWRRYPDHTLRPAWSLLAMGMALTLFGEAIRIPGELGLMPPLEVVVIGLNLAAYPFYLVSSAVRIQRAAGRSLSFAAMLDAITCALVTGAFGMLMVLPLAGTAPPAQLFGAVMPPLLCLGILIVALYLIFHTARDRPQPAALALAVAALLSTAGNWLVAVDTLTMPADWVAPLAMVLFVAGFVVLAQLPALDRRDTRRWPDPIGHLQSALVQSLPLLLLAILAILVIGRQWDAAVTAADLFTQRALAVGTLLVVARQWLMLRLNVRLLTSLQTTNAALAQAHTLAAREARTDSLTGLPNQRLLREYLTAAVATHRRAGLPLSVLFVDIDYFKLINDRHGHAVGDAVLAEIARRLRHSLREGDTVARFGGEEFVLLLPHTVAAEGQAVAERLRQAVAGEPIDVLDSGPLTVTASIGLATGDTTAMTADGLLRSADAAMYAAKLAGRDGVRATAD
jgi:diguanylate cyclase (GGDEF)-like protein